MKADVSLHELIDSLSKTEKTYFKKFSSRHSKNGNASSVDLFDAVERWDTDYDENKIKSGLENVIPADQFPVIKNYLYHNILKSLTLYHLESNNQLKLASYINSAELLYRRGLLKQSLKILTKARTLAEEIHEDIKLLEIINLERRSLKAVSSLNSSSAELLAGYREEEEVLERIENLSRYKKLFDELVIFLTGKGISHREEIGTYINKLLTNKLMKDISRAKTKHSKVLFHLIQCLAVFFLGDVKSSLAHSKKIVEISRESAGGKYRYGYEYVLASQQIVSCLRSMNRDTDAKKYVRELIEDSDDILKNYPVRVRQFLHSRTLISEVNNHISRGQYEKSDDLLKELLRIMPQAPYRDELIVINYNAAINCYALGEKEKALHHINVIFNSKALELRTDLQSAARIMNLILHYELGNLSNLKHFIRSVYNYLKKMNRLSEAEVTVLEFIKSLSKPSNKDEAERLFKKVRKDIAGIKSKPGYSETVDLGFFDFWIEKKIKEFAKDHS